MRQRSGPFWDGVEGRAPVPPAAATLGFEFIGADVGAGTIQSTTQLNVSFLRPARPGRLVGRGRVVHRDGDHAVLEADLYDPAEAVVATATASAREIPLRRARTAP